MHVILIAIVLFLVLQTHSDDTHKQDDSSVLFIRTQSLYPPYIDHEMSNRWYDFGGSTVVNTNKQIRLTPEFQGRKGWLRSKTPFYAESWSVEFEYKIHGKSSVSGDGFAFWFTEKNQDTQQGWLLGGPEQWHGLVVAFDTYDNGRHGYSLPYVSAMMNDGTRTYNKDTDGKELEIGGCQADIRNQEGYGTRARIKFIKGKYLKVELNTRDWNHWITCIHVTSNLTLFPTGYLGFTGETGGLTDNHDIISVSTNQILRDDQGSSSSPPPPATEEKHYEDSFQIDHEAQGGPSYLMMTMIFLGLGVGAYFLAKYLGLFDERGRDLKHF